MDLQQDELAPVRQPPPGPITYEEFLKWCDDDTWAEWVDGDVVPMPVFVTERNALILWLPQVMFGLATQMGRRGNAYSEPFRMRLPELRRGRAPDLFFVRPERLHLMDRHYMNGPADLVVEIVSPESVQRDRVIELAEYEQAGVREYWLVDAERTGAELRVLGPDGRYQLVCKGREGLCQSTVLPELRPRVEWLWQDEAPEIVETQRLLGQSPA